MKRFGLIGCGQHARWALFAAMDGASSAELAAVSDLLQENLDAPEVPDVPGYTDYREMIEKENLDAVYIATRVDAHCEPTVASLEAGLHVLCEKPMSDTVENCRRMIHAAGKAGRLLAIDFEARYYEHNRKIKQWIAEGRLGEVHAIHVQSFNDSHKVFGKLGARRHKSMNQNGTMNCGVHDLDLIRYLCGGDWLDVHARGAWFIEDTVYPPHQSIVARLSSGVLVTLNSSAAHTAYIQPSHQCHIMTIVGTKGVVHLCDAKAELVSETLCETIDVKHPHHSVAVAWVIDDFVGVLEGRKTESQTLASAEDGLAASQVVLEVNRQSVEARDAAGGC